MRKRSNILWAMGVGAGVMFLSVNCRKNYNPPVIAAANNYLVVDGIINVSPNDISIVSLGRTRNLGDTVSGNIPETGAGITIDSKEGQSYTLTDSLGQGVYRSDSLSLNPAQTYRLSVTTSNGKLYQSDFVTPKITPAIDSIYYNQPSDLTWYVDTHDANNATHYYRWDYEETWSHDATLSTTWGEKDGLIFVVDSTNQKTNCWTTVHSSDVLIDNTTTLGQDLVTRQKLLTIPLGDARISKRYSLLVRQYAMTEEAYNYWLLIQKSSQQLGTLFDLQPSQLIGNIHSVSNTAEPVIGFATACGSRNERVFVYNTNLHDWIHNGLAYSCDTAQTPVNQMDYRIYTYSDTTYSPYYFITNGPLVLAKKFCLDCTRFGGSNIKPPFW